MTMVQSIDAGASSIIAFGSLLDVARLLGGASAETCDACNTVNPLHAHLCKCCTRKLPAFYACRRREAGVILRRKPGAAMVRGWSALSMIVPGYNLWLRDRAGGRAGILSVVAIREAPE